MTNPEAVKSTGEVVNHDEILLGILKDISDLYLTENLQFETPSVEQAQKIKNLSLDEIFKNPLIQDLITRFFVESSNKAQRCTELLAKLIHAHADASPRATNLRTMQQSGILNRVIDAPSLFTGAAYLSTVSTEEKNSESFSAAVGALAEKAKNVGLNEDKVALVLDQFALQTSHHTVTETVVTAIQPQESPDVSASTLASINPMSNEFDHLEALLQSDKFIQIMETNFSLLNKTQSPEYVKQLLAVYGYAKVREDLKNTHEHLDIIDEPEQFEALVTKDLALARKHKEFQTSLRTSAAQEFWQNWDNEQSDFQAAHYADHAFFQPNLFMEKLDDTIAHHPERVSDYEIQVYAILKLKETVSSKPSRTASKGILRDPDLFEQYLKETLIREKDQPITNLTELGYTRFLEGEILDLLTRLQRNEGSSQKVTELLASLRGEESDASKRLKLVIQRRLNGRGTPTSASAVEDTLKPRVLERPPGEQAA